jgi:hypothetical protein
LVGTRIVDCTPAGGLRNARPLDRATSGGMELVRRHTAKQARALFALCADGALAADDAAAIDDARRKDATFDAEVRTLR